MELEHVLTLIDENILSCMESMRAEVLAYLRGNAEQLTREIATRGYGDIPTHVGILKVRTEDLF